MSAKDLAALVEKETGKTVGDIVGAKKLAADEARLADSLVAMKLLSDSLGGDAPGLARLAQGYDAMRTAASGGDPISLRVLSIGDYGGPQQVNVSPQRGNPPAQAANTGRDRMVAIKSLDDAINTLNTVPAAGFHVAATNAAAPPDMSESIHVWRRSRRLPGMRHPRLPARSARLRQSHSRGFCRT